MLTWTCCILTPGFGCLLLLCNLVKYRCSALIILQFDFWGRLQLESGNFVYCGCDVRIRHIAVSLLPPSYLGRLTLADLGGRARRAPPPYGSRFFRFDMQNFQNVAASGVHGPLYEVHTPPYGKSWIRHWLTFRSLCVCVSVCQSVCLPVCVSVCSGYNF